jgi:hypothetical protein
VIIRIFNLLVNRDVIIERRTGIDLITNYVLFFKGPNFEETNGEQQYYFTVRATRTY